jgi:hypothetical protein
VADEFLPAHVPQRQGVAVLRGDSELQGSSVLAERDRPRFGLLRHLRLLERIVPQPRRVVGKPFSLVEQSTTEEHPALLVERDRRPADVGERWPRHCVCAGQQCDRLRAKRFVVPHRGGLADGRDQFLAPPRL